MHLKRTFCAEDESQFSNLFLRWNVILRPSNVVAEMGAASMKPGRKFRLTWARLPKRVE